MAEPYGFTASQLLTYGDCDMGKRPNDLELGLGPEHVPELLRMARDPALNEADQNSVEICAPVHAWRALGQLRATEAIEQRLDLFTYLVDSDWATEELPDVYGMIGVAGLPALNGFVADTSNGMWPRITAAGGIKRIAITIRKHVASVLMRCARPWSATPATSRKSTAFWSAR